MSFIHNELAEENDKFIMHLYNTYSDIHRVTKIKLLEWNVAFLT